MEAGKGEGLWLNAVGAIVMAAVTFGFLASIARGSKQSAQEWQELKRSVALSDFDYVRRGDNSSVADLNTWLSRHPGKKFVSVASVTDGGGGDGNFSQTLGFLVAVASTDQEQHCASVDTVEGLRGAYDLQKWKNANRSVEIDAVASANPMGLYTRGYRVVVCYHNAIKPPEQ